MNNALRGTLVLRFGVFELDLRSGELRKEGAPVRLPPQPLKVLTLLCRRAGQLVTREEIQKEVWGGDTFVDFEHGLNFCIGRIREALGDDAEAPRYIQTLPRRGYRFLTPVETVAPVKERDEERGAEAGSGRPEFRDITLSPPAPRPEGGEGVPTLSKPGRGALDESGEPNVYRGAVGVGAQVVAPDKEAARLVEAKQRPWSARAFRPAALAAVALAVALGLALGVRYVWVPGYRSSTPIKSLAVLPLVNLSGDAAQEYFADGMTEALITELGRARALRVISRTSAMSYKGSKKSLPEIARELNVDAVVEGGALRSRNRVRITAQLIRAETDQHLWSEAYDRDLTDILALQGEVAQAIARQIEVNLTPQEQAHLASPRRVNPEAQEAYLRGRYFEEKVTEEGLSNAARLFEQAIAIDPNFAPAYVELADIYTTGVYFGWGPLRPAEAFEKARAADTKALEIDETLADAHASLSGIKQYYDWDWPGTERECKRALELNPSSAEAHDRYGTFLVMTGRVDQGIKELKLAHQLDPLSPVTSITLAWALYCGHRYEQSVEQAKKALEIAPDYPWLHTQLGMTYVQMRMYREAFAEIRKAVPLSGGHPMVEYCLSYAYAASGNRSEALKAIEQLRQRSRGFYASTTFIAAIYACLGEKQRAFEWLERACDQRSIDAPLLNVDPRFDSLRSDPRFQALLRHMNLPP